MVLSSAAARERREGNRVEKDHVSGGKEERKFILKRSPIKAGL
jgi:hypothetical protein